MKRYFFNILLSLDIFVNALLGGNYYETLSARAHLAAVNGNRYWGWTEKFINALAFDQKHCERSYRWEYQVTHGTR
jgi:hypothetical protein